MEGKYGVQATTFAVNFAGSALAFYEQAMADKKIDAKDLWAALPALMALQPAMDNFNLVGRELDDLSDNERAYLNVLIEQQVKIPGAGAEIAPKLFSAIRANLELFAAVKALKGK